MKRILLLGATGSIGEQTLDIIREFDSTFTLVGATCNHSIEKMQNIIKEFNLDVVMMDSMYEKTIKKEHEAIAFFNTQEWDKLIDYYKEELVVVNALVGSVGLIPTMEALKHGHDVLLANKESLVVGGELIKPLLKTTKGRLIPVDSEHSALAQCLKGSKIEDIEKIVITASGGSFRDYSLEQLKCVSVEDALKHPNWSMGAKITIDSATMMNKVFEVIEAHYLFDLPYEKIDAVLHKESMVHGIVHFKDGNVLMHAGQADMHIPILTALSEPNRLPYRSIFDITKVNSLSFERLDRTRYALYDLGIAVAKKKGMHTVVMNAANEAAVALFLDKVIAFTDIEKIIVDCLHVFDNGYMMDLETVLKVDKEVRLYVKKTYLDGEKECL